MVRGRHRGVVEEERLFGSHRLGVLDELKRLVGDVLGEVIALPGGARLIHRMVVVNQIRIPLVRLGSEDPYQRSKPRPLGQLRRVEARFISSVGHRCHLPTMNVFHPCSPRISGSIPFSGGTVPLALGKPIAASVMQAMLLRVWLRPVNRHERVGEHRAVVCHWV